MKSISIKSAVAKLSFHIHDGCLWQSEVLNKVVWNVFNGFCIIFRPRTLSSKISVERSVFLLQYKNKSSKLFIRPTLSRRNVITKRFYYHSRMASHGRWGDHTSDHACQVGGFSTIRVFNIACKRSCWWVKVLIFLLKARLSCQTNASVSKNEAVSERSQTQRELVWVSMGWSTNLFINSNVSKLFY